MILRQAACFCLSVFLSATAASAAESFRAAGVEFNAAREVTVSAESAPSVVAVEFLHHGEISADGRNVAVLAANHELAPFRVLQVGPGDFCRIAFQRVKRQTRYQILYGGDPPERDKLPAWTNKDGLLLETRRYVPCNLRRFESVRAAFESAEPLAAGYVDTVQHATNPFRPECGPFMSRYHGRLHVPRDGEYTFWTSSQDCSFLLIDGRVVVDAPGRHWPIPRARPGSGRTVQLSSGLHDFDYYHVAAGRATMMVAAWIAGRPDNKTRPMLLPPEAFRAGAIAQVAPGPPSTHKTRLLPDFDFTVTGDVPLPDNPSPLVGATFKDRSSQTFAHGGVQWDFGDGQTGDEPRPTHVFLKPGLYQVTLSRRHGSQTTSITNRIEIERPVRTWASRDVPPTLDDYLPVLKTYDPKTLDAASLGQLVETYLWKTDQISLALEKQQAAGSKPAAEKSRVSAPRRRDRSRTIRARRESKPEPPIDAASTAAAMRQYRQLAVDVVRVALTDGTAAKGDGPLHKLMQTITPVARFDLGDSQATMRLVEAAAGRIANPKQRAECQLLAADVAVNDLLDTARGRALLEAAQKSIASRPSPAASRLQRVWGDYYAIVSDGAAARRAYADAERLLPSRPAINEQTARRGARSRSTEQFLRASQWPRAARELDQWQNEFPADKLNGTLALLQARYWSGREKYAQAAALAEGLVAVNPDSPYADQLLYLAARCESKQGRPSRAVALLNQLLKDYPGSPLAPEVKRRLNHDE